MQELQGVIDNIVFQSEDNQFSVFRVKTDHEGKVSVVYRGPAPFFGRVGRAQRQLGRTRQVRQTVSC